MLIPTRLLSSATGDFEVYRQLLQLLLVYSVSNMVVERIDGSETSETSMC
jgi:hypothetical protein